MRHILAAAAALCLLFPAVPEAKTKVDKGFTFPKDQPIKIILFRPDMEVASLGAGGVPTPNPDWTTQSRQYIQQAIVDNQKGRSIDIVSMPELQGEDASYALEYQQLYRAVVNSAFTHSVVAKLPTKKGADRKYRFDWTLGPGSKRLGELGGGKYGLFLVGYDAYATAGRKGMQIFVLLATAALGAPQLPQGGLHYTYASLVDLDTGNLVWFNYYLSKKGDIRTAEGAKERAAALLSTMPLREGEIRPKPARTTARR